MITYDEDVLRLMDEFTSRGLYVGSVCITQYSGQESADLFKKRLENIFVIGDPKIATYIILVNVIGTDNNNDLRLIRKLHQHTELAVRFKTRKNTGCMVVVKQFAAEFKIKFVAELTDSFTDVFLLHFQIFVIIQLIIHFFPPLVISLL